MAVGPRRPLAGGLVVALALASCGGSHSDGETYGVAATQPNVLLIVVDTLRADALGVYGATGGDTPEIDRFAETALVIEQASSPRAKTTPAIASLLTGTYPPEHGVRDLGRPLRESGPTTLAETFASNGYVTAAIVGNYVLARERSGLDRGFQRWIESFPDAGDSEAVASSAPERRARSLTDGALELLDELGPKPFFLYLHYMDPHGPYDPPAEHRVEPGPRRPIQLPEATAQFRQPLVAQYNVPASARGADGRIDAAVVEALYRGEVRSVDHELGRLFAELESRGLDENTIVILTSDHGESMGEHDYWFEHGKHAYEASCRVPMLLRGPGITPMRSETVSSLVDVATTLHAFLEIDLMREKLVGGYHWSYMTQPFHGRNLLLDHEQPVFSEKAEGNELGRTMQIDTVRIGRWKLVRRFAALANAGAEDPRERRVLAEELYDLNADPLEARDLMGVAETAAPLDALREQLDRWRAFDDGCDDAPKREPTGKELQRLRAMGYVGR